MNEWNLEPAHDLGLPPEQRFKSLRRESGLIETIGHFACWSSIRLLLGVVHRLRIEGREHIPRQPPFVLISNHASHLDALVLASPLPWRIRDRIFPIAAGDVFFETPLASVLSACLLNALPMWRRKAGAHAMHELRDRLLDEPCAYILFPEGTRSRDGAMQPFKPGLGMLVAGTDVPIIPCHLAGTHAALPPDHSFPRPHPITLRVGAPLRFSGTTNTRDGWEDVARGCEAAVRELASSRP
jgi:1-acyl-sn-glycerol-3-phosphate acyltransferase